MGLRYVSSRKGMAAHQEVYMSRIRNENSLSPAGPPERRCHPKVRMTPAGGGRSVEIEQPSLPLRWAPRTFMRGKLSLRRMNTRRKLKPRSPRKTLPHGRTKSTSRTYLPGNGSRYSACWSRITACGTAVWERWPR
jgi:hypothetical protein